MTDDPYVYPGTSVLRNKPGIRDAGELAAFERRMTTQRVAEGFPSGAFDLTHLQAIHRHLFQDVYDWAGEIRTVEISKRGHQFLFRQYIGNGMADVHRRIVAAGHLQGMRLADFADAAGHILGDVNYIEGNGRTQLLFLKQLAENAGHPLDLRYLDARVWHEVSRNAHEADYQPMSQAIRAALATSAGEGEGGPEP